MFDPKIYEEYLKTLKPGRVSKMVCSWNTLLNGVEVSDKIKVGIKRKYEVARELLKKRKLEKLDRQRAMWVDYWNSFTD